MNFTIFIKVIKKMDNTIHIKKSCCFFFVLPVWSTKHKEVKRV